jgi:iron/zinc/copper transport system substrate-binding protein
VYRLIVILTIIAIAITACGLASPSGTSASVILTSTSFLADITRNVADRVSVTSLLPVGTDPHSYQPSPQDDEDRREQVLIINGGL